VGFRDLFITEYLRRGTLDKAIFNATEHRKRINDRTLWLTLKCRQYFSEWQILLLAVATSRAVCR